MVQVIIIESAEVIRLDLNPGEWPYSPTPPPAGPFSGSNAYKPKKGD
jgi:hypothetical protein